MKVKSRRCFCHNRDVTSWVNEESYQSTCWCSPCKGPRVSHHTHMRWRPACCLSSPWGIYLIMCWFCSGSSDGLDSALLCSFHRPDSKTLRMCWNHFKWPRPLWSSFTPTRLSSPGTELLPTDIFPRVCWFVNLGGKNKLWQYWKEGEKAYGLIKGSRDGTQDVVFCFRKIPQLKSDA